LFVNCDYSFGTNASLKLATKISETLRIGANLSSSRRYHECRYHQSVRKK
jgi:hypothetical protein